MFGNTLKMFVLVGRVKSLLRLSLNQQTTLLEGSTLSTESKSPV